MCLLSWSSIGAASRQSISSSRSSSLSWVEPHIATPQQPPYQAPAHQRYSEEECKVMDLLRIERFEDIGFYERQLDDRQSSIRSNTEVIR